MREFCQGLVLSHHCEIDMTLFDNVPPIMAGDDVAVFLQKRPGCHFLLGQDGPMCHHPHYDFNDEVASTGVAMFEQLVHLRLGAGRDDNNKVWSPA